jgi:hypothetical protein
VGHGAHTAADIEDRHVAVSLAEQRIEQEARGR